jgi:hypothetical protein
VLFITFNTFYSDWYASVLDVCDWVLKWSFWALSTFVPGARGFVDIARFGNSHHLVTLWILSIAITVFFNWLVALFARDKDL